MILTWGMFLGLSTVASMLVTMGAKKAGGKKKKRKAPQEPQAQKERKVPDKWEPEEEFAVLFYQKLILPARMYSNAVRHQPLADKINEEFHNKKLSFRPTEGTTG
jgi:hypothetical protein